MPITVDIPEIGIVSFPDDMDEASITNAARNLYQNRQPTAPAVEQAVPAAPVGFESGEPARTPEELAIKNAEARKLFIQAGLITPPQSQPDRGYDATTPLFPVSPYLKTTPETIRAAEQAVAMMGAQSEGTATAEETQAALAEPSKPPGQVAKALAGAQNAVAESLDFFTSPLGISTLGIGTLPRIAQRVIAGAFVTDMVRHAPEQVRELADALKTKDTERKAKALTALGLTGAFVVAGTKGALGKGEAVTQPKEADAIYRQTEEVLRPVRPQPGEGEAQVPVQGRIEEAAARGGTVPEAQAGEVLLSPEQIAEFHSGVPVTKVLDTLNKALETRKAGPIPDVQIDLKNPLPRLQPWENDKTISSNPEGLARIPGGKFLDPRAGAFGEVDRGIIANAKERGVGKTIGALWGETNKGRVPFQADQTGAIKLTDGTKGYMSDVIEGEMAKPNSQAITPEQRKWIRDVWEPLNFDIRKMLSEEGVKGFEISEGEMIDPFKPYFPRVAIDKKNVPAGTPTTVMTGGSMGGRQFFQKERLYETEAEGSATTIYEPDPVKRVATLISQAYKAVADTRLSKDPALAGREIPIGGARFKTEAEVMQPAFRGRAFPVEIANKLNKQYGESTPEFLKNLSKLNDAMKSYQLTLDMSAPLVQGLPALFYKPKAWGKAVGNSVQAVFNENQMRKILDKPENAQAASELAQLGVGLARLQDFMAGATEGTMATRTPLIGPAIKGFGRGFGVFMDMAKMEMWKSLREVTPKNEWPRMAEFIENLTGTSRMETIGLTQNRALAERLLFLAPSYYRTAPALIRTMMTNGATGAQARNALARFGMGVVFTSVAGMMAMGLSWDEINDRLDPSQGKFLKVPVKVGDRNIEVGFGHLFTSVARLVGDTVEQANSDKPIGYGVEAEPWKKWTRNHSGPVPSLIADLYSGTDPSGRDISNMDAILRRFTPITAQQAIDTEGTVGQRLADASLSFFGLNAFPQSVRDQFTKERDTLSQSRYDKNYDQLPIEEQVEIHRELKKDNRFTPPPSTARAMEMAFQNDVARQQKVASAIKPAYSKKLEELGLKVTGYQPVITVGEKPSTKLPLTRKQAERYEQLIIKAYNRTLREMDWEALAELEPEDRQNAFTEELSKAKTEAKETLIEESGED